MPSITTHILDPLDADGLVRPGHRRDLALLLASWSTRDGAGVDVGDPRHEQVTEGRTKGNMERRARGSKEVPYSSCGDLAHWLLMCLGCRDERLVNRGDDGGQTPWISGGNVSRLVQAPGYVRARGDAVPLPGDIPFLMNGHGGHVCVLRSWDMDRGVVVTDDYGQPFGRRRERTLTRAGGAWSLDGSPLMGWLDLDEVPLTGPAKLPDEIAEAL